MTAPRPEFDAYAARYESALAEGLSISGETNDFFARQRVEWLRQRLADRGGTARRIHDFGCGTGSTSPVLLEALGAEEVIGTDVSGALVARATAEHGSDRVTFLTAPEGPGDWADLAYCNGVFHHIQVDQRAAAVVSVLGSLIPGGHFAFWENNPWNPGTRMVMRRIEFDRDAIMLSPPEAKRLLAGVGFEVLETTSTFYFPRALAALRSVEPRLARIPLGAQYMVLARRPG